MFIGAQMRERRRNLHVSLKEVAKYLAWSHTTIGRAEIGIAIPHCVSFWSDYGKVLDGMESGRIHYQKSKPRCTARRGEINGWKIGVLKTHRERRLALGISLGDIACVLGIDCTTLSRYEVGENFVPPDIVVRYTKILDEYEKIDRKSDTEQINITFDSQEDSVRDKKLAVLAGIYGMTLGELRGSVLDRFIDDNARIINFITTQKAKLIGGTHEN